MSAVPSAKPVSGSATAASATSASATSASVTAAPATSALDAVMTAATPAKGEAVKKPASVEVVKKPAPTTASATAAQKVRPTKTPTLSPPAACSLPAAILGKDLTAVPTTDRVIALTFDGGGSDAAADSILAALEEAEVPATFFLTGDFVELFPSTAQRIASGYPIGNHTQNHPDLTTLKAASVRAEIAAGEASIRRVTGVDPRPYFRFPYGAVNSRVIGLVNDACYVPFRWTVDTLGWKGTSGGMSTESVTSRVLAGAKSGAIILMHLGNNPDDGSTLDADALPEIIEGLRAGGYTFVTLEEVLADVP